MYLIQVSFYKNLQADSKTHYFPSPYKDTLRLPDFYEFRHSETDLTVISGCGGDGGGDTGNTAAETVTADHCSHCKSVFQHT